MQNKISLQGLEIDVEDNIQKFLPHNDNHPEIHDENIIKEFPTVHITESEDGVETHNLHTLNDPKQELMISSSGKNFDPVFTPLRSFKNILASPFFLIIIFSI